MVQIGAEPAGVAGRTSVTELDIAPCMQLPAHHHRYILPPFRIMI